MNIENDNIQEAFAWMLAHKTDNGLTWQSIANASGIKLGTLTPFMGQKYSGNKQIVADNIFKYRESLKHQAELSDEKERAGIGGAPLFIQMPTARRIRTLMIAAQGGEMTVVATGPGTCKTMAAQNYAQNNVNVWLVTIKRTSRTLPGMVAETLKVVSGRPARGSTRQMVAQLIDLIRDTRGLLIFDEANHLKFEALEEIRGWYDDTSIGVCLLGNEELIGTIRHGSAGANRDAFRRLSSRIAHTYIRNMPQAQDIELYLDAWGIEARDQRKYLLARGLAAGSGGLREIRQIINHASMLAMEQEIDLSLEELRQAHFSRSGRD